ncbi:MAG: ROK family protein, partial [Oscillospiraceae bacterium]|nr:ROK family protein [Oscillospiraceae bacterium]
VTNVINIFFPEIVAFSGGVALQGEALLAPLREEVDRQSFGVKYVKKNTRLAECTLGYQAGVIGAALLAKQDA